MTKIKILFLSANPQDTDKLRLDEEMREIKEAMKLAQKRDRFEIISEFAVRVDDLRRALLEHTPQIVHFSGHGSGSRGIALEDNSGEMRLVNTLALARLFKFFSESSGMRIFKCLLFGGAGRGNLSAHPVCGRDESGNWRSGCD